MPRQMAYSLIGPSIPPMPTSRLLARVNASHCHAFQQGFDLEGDEVLGAAPYVETPLFDCLEAEGLSVNTLIDLVSLEVCHTCMWS